jgi:predicted nucleotidyltransferase
VGRVPVAVSTLVEKMLPPGALRSEFEALLERKRQLPEIGEGEALPALEAFIASEIARGNAGVEGLSKGPTDPSEVDRFLAATLRQHFPLV